MNLLWKIAFRDFVNNRKSFAILIINLSIGLSGLVTLEIIKDSFNGQMQNLSQSMLGGDIQVSSRRYVTEDELKTVSRILPTHRSTHMIRTLSMARSTAKSRLVQVRGIQSDFPFYGSIKVSQREDLTETKDHTGPPKNLGVWIYPEIRDQLQVKIGEQITIGSMSFNVAGYIIEEIALGSGAATIAPRIYLSIENLRKADLLQKGSTFADVFIYKLNDSSAANSLMKELNENLLDPAINARSHQYSGQQTARLFLYLSDFLGLVALAAVALSLVGVTFLFRSYLRTRLKDVAILNALGLSVLKSQWIYLIQILAVGLLASLLSLLIGYGLLPVAYGLLEELLPFQIDFKFSPRLVLSCLAIGTFSGFLATYPFFKALNQIKANQLFQEITKLQLKMNLRQYLYWLPAFLGFSALSFWLANSYIIGGFFIIFFGSSVFLLLLMSLITIPLLRRMQIAKTISLRLSARSILRTPVASLTVFISLSLATVLILLVPFIEHGLIQEFKTPKNLVFPSFFLFDIQDEQLDPLQKTMTDLGSPIDRASPLIRGRMISINGKSFEKAEITDKLSRDEQLRRRMINRGLNLSTRKHLSSSETIIEGQWVDKEFDWDNDKLAALSVEYRYASRLNLKLGDQLGIEVQGVEFLGRITSIRRIRWISFQPNFFIQVQPGVIDDAPKTWVANLKPVENDLRVKIQNTIVDKFPNVSVVDVSRTVQTILVLVEKLATAIRFMALISFIVGLTVLVTLVREQVYQKRFDFNLLKVIGATNALVQRIALTELMLVSLYATITGATLALVASFSLSYYLFDGIWVMPWVPIIGYVTPLMVITSMLCYLVARAELIKAPKLQN